MQEPMYDGQVASWEALAAARQAEDQVHVVMVPVPRWPLIVHHVARWAVVVGLIAMVIR